ncbi:hypothetical protein TcG_12742 [Trypanosoma cruzi]|nr:hypothetical protein TcG_12742 [Trypanosoma cruzi]
MSLEGQFTTFLLHARSADERGELCGLFDGNRCGAIDPTAARQDAAVHVGNVSNPAGYGDSGVTKNCGTIGDEAGAPPDKGRDESSNPQSDRLEGTCCFSTRVDNDESFVRDCGPNPNSNSTMEADGTLILGWSVAPKTARADPHRASRFVKIRGQDAFDTIKLCRTLQENEKLTHLTTAQVERDLASWNATAHSIERGALRHAAQIVETYNFESTRDLAVGEARRPVRPSPEYCSIFGDVHHTADPGVVAGRIDVRGGTSEGQEPWLRAEERFSMIFITTMLLQ